MFRAWQSRYAAEPVMDMSASNVERQVDIPLASGSEQEMSEALARNWWAIALRGVLAIIFGAIAFILPGATMLSLVLVFAAYAVVDGVFAITSAVRSARRHERWGLLAFEGVVDIVAGGVAFFWPGLSLLPFVLPPSAWGGRSRGLL